eukprot:TRINITY_DN1028_c0_g1_i1.p1 TRINITY_DN1028_c0_g1~~TRINITY_DN1028_c0_g1_i1.p1  ORF type:complete len:695 (+),score=206.02 TRINITY_DN1028_c0_g1_i1:105-2189(+)
MTTGQCVFIVDRTCNDTLALQSSGGMALPFCVELISVFRLEILKRMAKDSERQPRSGGFVLFEGYYVQYVVVNDIIVAAVMLEGEGRLRVALLVKSVLQALVTLCGGKHADVVQSHIIRRRVEILFALDDLLHGSKTWKIHATKKLKDSGPELATQAAMGGSHRFICVPAMMERISADMILEEKLQGLEWKIEAGQYSHIGSDGTDISKLLEREWNLFARSPSPFLPRSYFVDSYEIVNQEPELPKSPTSPDRQMKEKEGSTAKEKENEKEKEKEKDGKMEGALRPPLAPPPRKRDTKEMTSSSSISKPPELEKTPRKESKANPPGQLDSDTADSLLQFTPVKGGSSGGTDMTPTKDSSGGPPSQSADDFFMDFFSGTPSKPMTPQKPLGLEEKEMTLPFDVHIEETIAVMYRESECISCKAMGDIVFSMVDPGLLKDIQFRMMCTSSVEESLSSSTGSKCIKYAVNSTCGKKIGHGVFELSLSPSMFASAPKQSISVLRYQTTDVFNESPMKHQYVWKEGGSDSSFLFQYVFHTNLRNGDIRDMAVMALLGGSVKQALGLPPSSQLSPAHDKFMWKMPPNYHTVNNPPFKMAVKLRGGEEKATLHELQIRFRASGSTLSGMQVSFASVPSTSTAGSASTSASTPGRGEDLFDLLGLGSGASSSSSSSVGPLSLVGKTKLSLKTHSCVIQYKTK